MTDSTPTAATPAPASRATAKPPRRRVAAQPVLEQLFSLYPHLFGQRFVPLKRGIYQDLLAAQPETFDRDALKTALSVHTRSTRYLQCVASGAPRHDLQGQPVEPVAPEHVFQAIVELFQRRLARGQDDALARLQKQLMAAYAASGLSRQDYLIRMPLADDTVMAALDEAVALVEQERARYAALKRAYELSGQSVEAFADSLGMPVRQVQAALKAS